MATSPAIRRARPDEADRLTAIALAAKRHWDYPEAWIEAWRDQLTFTTEFITSHPVFVAVGHDDTPIACYALVENEDAVLQLEHVWVEPSAIGRGVGRTLFHHAVATARERGGTALLIDSDPNAEAFYVRMGATRVGSIRADVCGEQRALPQLQFDLRAANR